MSTLVQIAEGCSATQHMVLLRSHQISSLSIHYNVACPFMWVLRRIPPPEYDSFRHPLREPKTTLDKSHKSRYTTQTKTVEVTCCGGGKVIHAYHKRSLTIEVGKKSYPTNGLPKVATLPGVPSESTWLVPSGPAFPGH